MDRDGTLIEERDYLSRPEEVAPFANAAESLLLLQNAGFKLVIISNQSGVGRGYFTLEDVAKVNARLAELFAADGVRFEKIYIAPEAPEQPSRGRKPSPQFLFDARDEFGLDLSASYMIGDKWTDVECGWNARVRRSILVRTGYGSKAATENAGRLGTAVVAKDLGAAAQWILEDK